MHHVWHRSAYLMDWINRVDLMTTWYIDTPVRRDQGVFFALPFYDLSPVLIAHERTHMSLDFWDTTLLIFRPFSGLMWTTIAALFFAVGILDAFNDGRLRSVREKGWTWTFFYQLWYGFYSAMMSFIAAGGLGYDGEIGGTNTAGRVLQAIWAFTIWLLRAGYVRNPTRTP